MPAIFAALEKQLGLKPETVKDAAVDVSSLDRMEETRAGNRGPKRGCAYASSLYMYLMAGL